MRKKHVASHVQRWAHVGILSILLSSPIIAVFTFWATFIAEKPATYNILGLPVFIDKLSWFDYIMFLSFGVACIVGSGVLIQYIWKFFDEPILGRVSFDRQAVTFYTKTHTIVFPYNECVEIGFTKWFGDTAPGRYVYYIYFSKIALNEDQRSHLFEGRSKTKRGKRNMPLYQSEYVLFQYRAEVFADFIECVPERFRTNLIETAESLHLNWYERILHK